MTLAENLFENLRLELRRGCLTLAVLAQLRQEHYGYTLRKALAESSFPASATRVLGYPADG